MIVTLLTGCNLGDQEQLMKKALLLIDQQIGKTICCSSLHESEPFGFESDHHFLNQVIQCETSLTPEVILEKIWEIERSLGRERGDKTTELNRYQARQAGEVGFSSRTMDIDILFYGAEIIATPLLTIPHPELHLRPFVLKPLCEVAGNMIHPILNKRINEL